MKLHIPTLTDGKVRTGGGWTFKDAFSEHVPSWGQLTSEAEADLIFIPGATMVPMGYTKPAGKKMVLRVDNALRHSRNKGRGMGQLKHLAEQADAIVYQSRWAHHYLNPINDEGVPEHIIVNGTNTELFRPSEAPANPDWYLYVKSSTDEGKEWIRAWYWYWYQDIQRVNPDACLAIAGKFGDDLINNNFDFWNDERFNYYGFVDAPTMAWLYQQSGTLIHPFYNDACSNTLIEYLSCNPTGNVELIGHRTGGVPDILDGFAEHGPTWLDARRMVAEYRRVFEGVLNG